MPLCQQFGETLTNPIVCVVGNLNQKPFDVSQVKQVRIERVAGIDFRFDHQREASRIGVRQDPVLCACRSAEHQLPGRERADTRS